jgi:hypothetical protein
MDAASPQRLEQRVMKRPGVEGGLPLFRGQRRKRFTRCRGHEILCEGFGLELLPPGDCLFDCIHLVLRQYPRSLSICKCQLHR